MQLVPAGVSKTDEEEEQEIPWGGGDEPGRATLFILKGKMLLCIEHRP